LLKVWCSVLAKDLRYFIQYLEENAPEEIVRVKRAVDPRWEMSAVLRRFQAENKFPAVLFENSKGFDMPVLSNVFASRRRLACMLETSEDKMLWKYMEKEDNRLEPEVKSSGPVKDVVVKGKDVDLRKFPIPTHCEKDAGPYINVGVTVVKDLDTGIRNAGMYRMMLQDSRTLAVFMEPASHVTHIFRKYERAGKDMEAVVSIGHHPALALGAQSKVPLGIDELGVAGALLGEPLELVKCETVDLEVPSYSEIAIEGRFKAGERTVDGPFGEYPWTYGPQRSDSKVFEVSAITHRRNPIFLDLFNAHIDHNYCAKLARESILYKRVKQFIPQVTAVALPESGVCRYLAYVQIRKEYDGLGKNTALVALASEFYIKTAVVVDEDVDINSDKEVLWAIMTRTKPDQDFFFVPDAHTSALDPSGYSIKGRTIHGHMNTKLGIDATNPVELPSEERADVSRELWEKIKIEDYLKQ